MRTSYLEAPKGGGGWHFRCPRSFYRVADDWNEHAVGQLRRWDEDLLDICVINTNKSKGVLNFLGVTLVCALSLKP